MVISAWLEVSLIQKYWTFPSQYESRIPPEGKYRRCDGGKEGRNYRGMTEWRDGGRAVSKRVKLKKTVTPCKLLILWNWGLWPKLVDVLDLVPVLPSSLLLDPLWKTNSLHHPDQEVFWLGETWAVLESKPSPSFNQSNFIYIAGFHSPKTDCNSNTATSGPQWS